jgi:hypothetical protein
LRFALRKLGKQELVVPCALRAFDASSGGGYELGIAFVERCLFEKQEDVLLYPLVQVFDRKQDTLGLATCPAVPLLAEAVRKGLLLLGWLQLRQ